MGPDQALFGRGLKCATTCTPSNGQMHRAGCPLVTNTNARRIVDKLTSVVWPLRSRQNDADRCAICSPIRLRVFVPNKIIAPMHCAYLCHCLTIAAGNQFGPAAIRAGQQRSLKRVWLMFDRYLIKNPDS